MLTEFYDVVRRQRNPPAFFEVASSWAWAIHLAGPGLGLGLGLQAFSCWFSLLPRPSCLKYPFVGSSASYELLPCANRRSYLPRSRLFWPHEQINAQLKATSEQGTFNFTARPVSKSSSFLVRSLICCLVRGGLGSLSKPPRDIIAANQFSLILQPTIN